MKNKIASLLSALSVLAMLSVWVAPVHAEQTFNVEKAIAAGNHKGLADYYHSQAEEQKKITEMHDKMKTEYRTSHVHYKGSENVLAGHCGNLQLKSREMAEEYEKLAQQEERLANKK